MPEQSPPHRAGEYGDRQGFLNVMRHAMALNGSFFTPTACCNSTW